MAANAEEVEELPAASCLCNVQGNIQVAARPASWIPCIRSLHEYHETWSVSANPVVCCRDVQQAVAQLRNRNTKGNVFSVGYIKEDIEMSHVQIVVFTKMRYVFVLKLKFVASASGGCEAKVKSFASGLMPAWFPLCFVFSSLFCFVPFYDFGFSALWLTVLRNRMTIPIEVKERGRQC